MRAPPYAQKSVRNLLTEARTSFKGAFPLPATLQKYFLGCSQPLIP